MKTIFGLRAAFTRLAMATFCLWLLAPVPVAYAGEGADTTRADLVGTWRLLRIEREGPDGVTPDAFYGPGTRGLLVYDASGAISVQISGEKRPAVEVPLARPVPPGSAAEIAAERAAFHSYYAYTGTWHYDEATSVCTHRVEVALLSVEEGMSYEQEVTREGDLLVFIRRGAQDGSPVIYRKVWQKL
jgi:Lipocalin-like domain